MRLQQVGESALLVECADLAEVRATYAVVRARQQQLGATDVVPAARTVLVSGLPDLEVARAVLGGLDPGPGAADVTAGTVVEIPVTYDGPDLAEVARQWKVAEQDVARIHGSTEFVVAFCGFAPGFAYCTGLPDDLGVRRRPEPRPRVPAGSVAVAGQFTSVYPALSPGGWQLIGSTSTPVWRPDTDRPALLEPGTRVRFRDAAAGHSPSKGRGSA